MGVTPDPSFIDFSKMLLPAFAREVKAVRYVIDEQSEILARKPSEKKISKLWFLVIGDTAVKNIFVLGDNKECNHWKKKTPKT